MPSVEKTHRNADGSCWTRIHWYLNSVRQTPVTVRGANAKELRRAIDAELGRLTHEIHVRKTQLGAEKIEVGKVMCCSDLVREWITLHVRVELADATQRAYVDDAADWFCPFWGDRVLAELGRDDGLKWRAWLLDEITASGKSRLGDYEHAGYQRVNRLLTMGRSIFTFALKNHWITEQQHPLKQVKDLDYIAPADSHDFLFEPELAEAVRLVIAQVKPQHRENEVLQMECRLAISCFAYLGLTQQDLFDARFKQALNHDGTPHEYFDIPRRPSGSGRKSRARKREVINPGQVQEEFVALWRARGCPSLDELIFPNGAGKKYSRQNWQRDFWRPALGFVRQLELEMVAAGSGTVVSIKSKPVDKKPRFHDIPAGEGIGPHAARRCAVRLWGLAGHLEVEVLDALGHHETNRDSLFRFYAKAKKDARKRERFLTLEEQIDAARAVYWSDEALAERERVLAVPRAEAEAARSRQKLGRRGGEETRLTADEQAA